MVFSFLNPQVCFWGCLWISKDICLISFTLYKNMNACNKPSVLEIINLNESSSSVAFAGCAAMGTPVVPLAGVRTSVAAGGGRGGARRGPVHRQWPQPKHGLRHLCGQPGALPKDPSAPSAALRHRASHPSHAVLQTSHPDDSLYSSGFSHTSSFLILVFSVIIAHYLSSRFSCSNIKTKPWPCSPIYLTMSTLCPYILCPFPEPSGALHETTEPIIYNLPTHSPNNHCIATNNSPVGHLWSFLTLFQVFFTSLPLIQLLFDLTLQSQKRTDGICFSVDSFLDLSKAFSSANYVSWSFCVLVHSLRFEL